MAAPEYEVDPSFWEDVVITFPDPPVVSSAPWKSAWMIEKEKTESATASDVQNSQENGKKMSSQDSFYDSQIVFENVHEVSVDVDTSATLKDVADSVNYSPVAAPHSQSIMVSRDIGPVSAHVSSAPRVSWIRNDSVDSFDEPFGSPAKTIEKEVSCSQCGSQMTQNNNTVSEQLGSQPMNTPQMTSIRHDSVDSFDEPFRSPAKTIEMEVSCTQCGSQMAQNASTEAPPSQPGMSRCMFNGNRLDMLLCEQCMRKNRNHKEHKNPAEYHRKTLFWCDSCATENAKAASIRDEKKRKATDEGECSKKRSV